jgi:hypothetical protein
MNGEGREALAHAEAGHGERAEHSAVLVARLVEDPRATRIPVEPPVELRRRHRLAVRLLHQREEVLALRRLDDHLDEVPSAALNRRRA